MSLETSIHVKDVIMELVDIVLSYFIKAEEEPELSHLLFLEYL